tara:strand:- start:2483 stop:2719 length:237 start_codon:yes stop_codon:yes gene_type:complete
VTPVRQTVKFDKKLLDQDAVKVVQTLIKAGYDAYLVGGCIRDLLLGYEPKDFDIATNATQSKFIKLLNAQELLEGASD